MRRLPWLVAAVLIELGCSGSGPLSSGSQRARIELHLRDAATGAPISGRIGLSRGGRPIAFTKVSGFAGWSARRQRWLEGGGEVSWYVEANSALEVAPGPLRLVVNRGTEYVPFVQELALEPGQTEVVLARLDRWIDLRRMGWRSADFHLHIGRFSQRQDAALETLLETEGLEAAALVDWAGRATGSSRSPHWGGWAWRRGELGAAVTPGGRLLLPAQHWAMPDRACELGLFGHRTPVTGRSKVSRAAIVDRVVAEGGIAAGAMGHLFTEGALLGKVGAVEVLAAGRFRGLDEWYRLLDVGCHVGAIAGTDVQSDAEPQAIVDYHSPPGADRFYIHLGTDALDAARLLRGVARGRTFVTSGPALLLTVNGMMPGDEVSLGRPDRVVVTVTVAGPSPPRGRLSLIMNGATVWHSDLAPVDGISTEELELDVERSAWIAARFDGEGRPPGSDRPLAHTSPVYVAIGDRLAFDADEARALLDELPTAETIAESGFSSGAEQAIALRWADDARRVLTERIGE